MISVLVIFLLYFATKMNWKKAAADKKEREKETQRDREVGVPCSRGRCTVW